MRTGQNAEYGISIRRGKNTQSDVFRWRHRTEIFYNLPRFSEDLDFNTPGLGKDDFKELGKDLKEGSCSGKGSHRTREIGRAGKPFLLFIS